MADPAPAAAPFRGAPDPSSSGVPSAVSSGEPSAAPGEFERYGLLAALTLVVLSLLLADRLRPSAAPLDAVAPGGLVRLEIGSERAAPRRPTASTRARPAGRLPAERATVVPDRSAPPAERTHVVRAGETLGEIARSELGTTKRAAEIAALNGLRDVNAVREGQSLRIPAR